MKRANNHPSESVAAVVIAAGYLAFLTQAGVDRQWAACIALGLAVVPGAVTWLVNRLTDHGIRRPR